jgi:hypothetical protein
METAGVFTAACMIVVIGWIVFLIALFGTAWVRRGKISFDMLFKDFKLKIWMTTGLGLVFFGLFFCSVYGISFLMNQENRLALFFLLYKNPIFFIYFGLFTFACISTSIYLVRLLIKYLCNRAKF